MSYINLVPLVDTFLTAPAAGHTCLHCQQRHEGSNFIDNAQFVSAATVLCKTMQIYLVLCIQVVALLLG